jgi:hypothetical protein
VFDKYTYLLLYGNNYDRKKFYDREQKLSSFFFVVVVFVFSAVAVNFLSSTSGFCQKKAFRI